MKTIRSSRPLVIWLLAGVVMIIIQIILGGITRLTDSGLSITEWKPILGTIPPMTDGEWAAAFEKYKQIAQYKDLHFYFTLEDFKSIYFWEWLHRNWGRLIGIVFIIPFCIFLYQRRISKDMIKPLIILFLLGGMQGAIGWIMVQSGLKETNLYVSHIRLAAHFIMALLLLAYTFWFTLQVQYPNERGIFAPALKRFTVFILVLLTIQFTYGAFMAGLKAGVFAPTWPDINGGYLPDMTNDRGRTHSWASSLVNHPLTIHFIHRNLAYLLSFLILIWTVMAAKHRASRFFNGARWWPLVFVLIQVTLGILTVINSPYKIPRRWGSFEWMAQLHQFVALLLLLSLLLVFYLLHKKRTDPAL